MGKQNSAAQKIDVSILLAALFCIRKSEKKHMLLKPLTRLKLQMWTMSMNWRAYSNCNYKYLYVILNCNNFQCDKHDKLHYQIL